MHRNNKLNLDKLKFNLFNMLHFFIGRRDMLLLVQWSLCAGTASKKNFWGNRLLAEHEYAFELLRLFFSWHAFALSLCS